MSTVEFNFVIDCNDVVLEKYKSEVDIESPVALIAKPDLSWCLQTYLILKKKTRLPVFCSNKLRTDCINIVHSSHLLHLKGTPSHFIVCIQADFPRREWAQYHLVQNREQARHDASYVPFWITPGLIKRDSSRCGVQRVAYAGQTFNGNLAGTEIEWKNLFKKEGLEFFVMEKDSWHDLANVDILIGIRSFDEKKHNTKPPSKLINAWHAGIPFIGGYDSAYTQVGTPGIDYFKAKTPEEILSTVLRLKNEPTLYLKIVQNGEQKASLYTNEKIVKMWESLLQEKLYPRYKQWLNHRSYETIRFYSLLTIGVLRHKLKQFAKKFMINKLSQRLLP